MIRYAVRCALALLLSSLNVHWNVLVEVNAFSGSSLKSIQSRDNVVVGITRSRAGQGYLPRSAVETRLQVFDRMSEECISAIVVAQEGAARFASEEVTPELCLIGMLDKPEGAKSVIQQFEISPRHAKVAMKKMYAEKANSKKESSTLGSMFMLEAKSRKTELTFSMSLRKVFNLAAKEADKLDSPYINSEHVLLALIGDPIFPGVEPIMGRIAVGKNYSPATFRSRLVSELMSKKDDGKELATGDSKVTMPTLEEIGVDLTALAKQRKLDDVYGRDKEIGQALRTLSRRRKNNPCLVGEPGVGKTAIAEGIAMVVSSANLLDNPEEINEYYENITDEEMEKLEQLASLCPSRLRGHSIVSIELANLVAGTKYRGEFEERVQGILKEVTDPNAPPTILFIDEIHLLIGAGKADGGMDAANVLKPALARGQVQLIGATTISEYRQYIESDAALERRLQPLMVAEPSAAETIEIVKTLLPAYEKHFGVKYSQSIIELAVMLSERYIKDRFMPDKALDVIDEAGAYTASIGEIFVEEDDVLFVLSEMSGVPVSGLKSDKSSKVIRLESMLQDRVIGQPTAVKSIVKCLKRYHAGLRDEKRPVGCFMFAGPTGVGKTELCKQLANAYFTNKSDLIRLDMSEFMESYTVSKLIGPPPGYVGYEAGGALTNAVRKNPHAIILLDEFEKAHPDVWNILLQIMDDGILTDGKGRTVYFREAIVVLTSNVGSKRILEVAQKHSGSVISSNEPVTFKPNAPTYNGVSGDRKNTMTQSELMKEVQSNPKALSVIQDAMQDKELLKVIQTPHGTPEDMSNNPKVARFLNDVWDALDVGGSLDDADFLKGLFNQVDMQAKAIEEQVTGLENTGYLEIYSEMADVVKEELQMVIRPEILNRLDEIIVFEPLSTKSLGSIANILLNDAIKRASRERNLEFTITDTFMEKVVTEGGLDSEFGARPMRRAVQRYFEDTISEAIVENFITEDDNVVIDLAPDELSAIIIRGIDGLSMEIPIEKYNGGIGGRRNSEVVKTSIERQTQTN